MYDSSADMRTSNHLPLQKSLRQKAEELFRTRGIDLDRHNVPPEFEEILEELHLHQIELEIQNEALRSSQSWQQAAETRFQHLYEITPIGYLVMDRNGRILHANRAACSCFGNTPEHMTRSVFTILIDPSFSKALNSHLEDVFTHEKSFPAELRLQDGVRWIRIESVKDPFPPKALIDSGEVGTSLHIAAQNATCLTSIIDITDQKVAQFRLNDSLVFHSTVINAIVHGLAVINVDTHKIEMANDAYGGIDAVAHTCHEFTHRSAKPCSGEEHPCPITTIRRTGRPAIVQHIHYDEVGRKRYIEVHAHPIFDRDHRLVRVVEQCIDVTEKINTEKNLNYMEKMASIGQLAAGIAHNFNNQLTGVIGYSHILLKKLDSPQLRRYVENLLTGAERSAQLTKQMLAFARLNEHPFSDVDLHKIVEEVISLAAHTLPANIQIKHNLLASSCNVYGAQDELQNAILNLAVNAKDAMPNGGELAFDTSTLELTESECADLPFEVIAGTYVCLCVSDTGTGIAPDVLPRIFDPFFTTKDINTGTGMGLATVYGTVKSHNAAITVHSEMEKGTCFKLYFPMSMEKQPLMNAVSQEPVFLAPYPATILLIDDNEIVRSIGEDMMMSLGYTVVTKSDGIEGLEYFKKYKDEIDVVILDMVMPRMGGGQAYEEMRKIDEKVMVVIASGYSLNREGKHLLEKGAREFVQKPFDMGQLSRALHNILTGAC